MNQKEKVPQINGRKEKGHKDQLSKNVKFFEIRTKEINVKNVDKRCRE